jgi:sugar phosphate isomerase/epimerase
MTADESYAYHVPQIEAAAKLGFPVARCQFLAGAEVIRRLAPLAERLNVKLGMELHAPETVTSPTVMVYREMMAKENSPYLGFIPDFSSSARAVPKCFLDFFRQNGIAEKYIEIGLEAWRAEGSLPERLKLYQEMEKAAGASESVIRGMYMMFTMLGKMDPKAWAEIVPQAVHIHGKCYDFDEQGNEQALPYEEILPVFVESGYNGFMSTEWEGHAFSDASGFEKVAAQQALCKRILSKYAVQAST